MWLDGAIEKALSIIPAERYAAMSEWLMDLRRPNPKIVSPQELPLLKRNPLRFWQMIAGVGWLSFITLLLSKFLNS